MLYRWEFKSKIGFFLWLPSNKSKEVVEEKIQEQVSDKVGPQHPNLLVQQRDSVVVRDAQEMQISLEIISSHESL